MTMRHVVAAALLLVGSVALYGTAKAQSTRAGYYGVVSKSDSREVGSQFTFANLLSDRPFVTFPNGRGEQSTKVYEDEDVIVLIFVASRTGSTESFYIAKKRGRFTLIEVGALEAVVKGGDFKPSVTYGTLK